MDLGRIWDGFGKDFEQIFEAFWTDFNGILGRFLKLFERTWKDKQ